MTIAVIVPSAIATTVSAWLMRGALPAAAMAITTVVIRPNAAPTSCITPAAMSSPRPRISRL